MPNGVKEVFIVDALRTPFGSLGGALSEIPAPILASLVIKGLIKRNDIPAEKIDEIIIGQVLQGGCGQAPARQAMLHAGLPAYIPATTINKVCSSGLQSMIMAHNSIKAGEAGIVIAGGMENMSLAPYILPFGRKGRGLGHGQVLDMLVHDGLEDAYSRKSMGEVTEDWLEKNGYISRKDQDDYAIRSYKLAKLALCRKIFEDELVPVPVKTRAGEVIVSEDEEPKKVDFDKLKKLRPVFKEGGTITAGNSSTINDGAALALIVGTSAVNQYSLRPVAKLVTFATCSMAPELFPEADIHVIRKVVRYAGLQIADIGVFEINEAFAAVAIITAKTLGLDMSKVNVNGGAVAIGHPIGASGGRLVATLIKEMRRRNERYGVVALCNGGGEAVASVFELV